MNGWMKSERFDPPSSFIVSPPGFFLWVGGESGLSLFLLSPPRTLINISTDDSQNGAHKKEDRSDRWNLRAGASFCAWRSRCPSLMRTSFFFLRDEAHMLLYMINTLSILEKTKWNDAVVFSCSCQYVKTRNIISSFSGLDLCAGGYLCRLSLCSYFVLRITAVVIMLLWFTRVRVHVSYGFVGSSGQHLQDELCRFFFVFCFFCYEFVVNLVLGCAFHVSPAYY